MNKQVDVLVGCQFGSEGKGLVAGILAKRKPYDWLISVNSAQAGHTVIYKGEPIVTRQIPSAAVINHKAGIYIGAGAIINIDVLLAEIDLLESKRIPIVDRLNIHQKALLISEEDIQAERGELELKEKIGSTCEGVGMALSRRVLRSAKVFEDYSFNPRILRSRVSDHFVIDEIQGNILLEGSQGFGLSNFSKFYPFCTSRDTTTAAFLSYARINPRFLRHVYGVYRSYPIRVGGNSGQMYKEVNWEIVAQQSGYPQLSEITTVTKRVRRVGIWDARLAKAATAINGVDRAILTFANYINRQDESCDDWDKLSQKTKDFVNNTATHVGGWYGISTDREGTLIDLGLD
jgi:adenylosuccinate synthase